MFDCEKLSVGDVFYRVYDKKILRKPEHKVIDGVVWERKSFGMETQFEKFQIMGILRKSLEGEWCDLADYELENQFYIYNFQREDYFDTESYWFDMAGKDYFTNLEDARTAYSVKKSC